MTKAVTVDDIRHLVSLRKQKVLGSAIGPTRLIGTLVDLGFLVPAGVATRRLCDRCNEQHLADVVSTSEGDGWYCPADGFVLASPSEIAIYTVRIKRLFELLTEQVEKKRVWAKPQGKPVLWSIGSYQFQDLRIAIYFAADAADPETFNVIQQILDDEPRPDGIAVLTNDTREISRLALPHHGRIVELSECVDISEDGRVLLKHEWLARRVLPTRLIEPPKRGRPSHARDALIPVIEDLDRAGQLPPSVNAAATAALAEFKRLHPDKKPPGLSAAKDAVNFFNQRT